MIVESGDENISPAAAHGTGDARRSVIHTIVHKNFAPAYRINGTLTLTKASVSRRGTSVRPANFEA
jgi:hypothetical protein